MRRPLASLVLALLSAATTAHAQQVDISVPPQSHELRENDMVTLDCSTNGVITHWLLDNTRLTTGDGIMMSGSSIMFSAFKFSQAGEYRCVAASAHGALVSFPGSLTYFAQRSYTKQPEDIISYALLPGTGTGRHETLAFQCEFEELSYGVRPEITWEMRRGAGPITTAVKGGRIFPFQYDHIGYLEIHFPSVDIDNGTEVRCVATDPERVDQTVRSNWAIGILTDDAVPAGINSFSIAPPARAHFIEGQELILGCAKRIQNESFAIRWTREDIVNDFYIQGIPIIPILVPDGVTVVGFTNILLNQSFDHIGHVYSCRVFLDFSGDNVLKNSLIVSPPVLPTPPLSTIVRADVAVPLGEDISLRVDNYTGPIIWWKDGEVLTNGTKYRVFVDAGSSFFTVSSITEADGGVYQTEPLERVLTHVIYSLTVIGLPIPSVPIVRVDHTVDASVGSYSVLTISWTAATPPPNHYILEVYNASIGDTGPSPPVGTDPVLRVQVADITYSYDRAETGLTYFFRVRAVSDAGMSNWSGYITIVLPALSSTPIPKRTGTPAPQTRLGLPAWAIAIIVIILLLACCLLCCCVFCCCLLFCTRQRRRTYHAEKKEKEYATDMEKYRMETNDIEY